MGEYKQLKVNTKGRLWPLIKRCSDDILHGNVLVVDPSIGSQSSMPGFAILRGGVLVSCGTIEVDPSGTTHDRLYAIAECLRRDFGATQWHVLVIEDVPDRRFSAGGRGSLRQQVQLHRAVGAIHGAVRCDFCVAVHPATWHAVVPDDYVKSDAADAAAIAEVVRQYAAAHAVSKAKSRSGKANRRRG